MSIIRRKGNTILQHLFSPWYNVRAGVHYLIIMYSKYKGAARFRILLSAMLFPSCNKKETSTCSINKTNK